jgi:hypothetical protein
MRNKLLVLGATLLLALVPSAGPALVSAAGAPILGPDDAGCNIPDLVEPSPKMTPNGRHRIFVSKVNPGSGFVCADPPKGGPPPHQSGPCDATPNPDEMDKFLAWRAQFNCPNPVPSLPTETGQPGPSSPTRITGPTPPPGPHGPVTPLRPSTGPSLGQVRQS